MGNRKGGMSYMVAVCLKRESVDEQASSKSLGQDIFVQQVCL